MQALLSVNIVLHSRIITLVHFELLTKQMTVRRDQEVCMTASLIIIKLNEIQK